MTVLMAEILKTDVAAELTGADPRGRSEVDDIVAARIRLRRKILGLTSVQLADRLGVSLQQLQKYEVSKNRVSASRLKSLSQILKVPIDYFYTPLPNDAAGEALLGVQAGLISGVTSSGRDFEDFVSATECKDLIALYLKLSRKQQRATLELLHSMIG
jgi:transcriptional regulator with XRE-family HTH domain